MSNRAFQLIHKYACQLAELDAAATASSKIMVNLNGRIYETEDGCDLANLQPKDISIVSGDEVRYGHAFGVDDEGALLVGFPDGHTEAVNSGEVSIRGMYGSV